jgi:hypothetical protein
MKRQTHYTGVSVSWLTLIRGKGVNLLTNTFSNHSKSITGCISILKTNNTMRRTIITMAALALLTSCGREAESISQSSNSNFTVELLFEVDGCKVYRFQDCNRYHYFTNCKGETATLERHGKNNYLQSEITTAITDKP